MSQAKKTIQRGYAKINLHLDITGIMENGFHSVNTVMQSVSLYDTVTLTQREDNQFFVECNIPSVPTGNDNLAVKAANAFCDAANIRLGAHIYIDKHIPMAGGMAGGSADAAAVLRGMNELCGHPLTTEELCKIGSRLGADVPFCIVGGSTFADGKGDILHPFPSMPSCTLLIACGGEGVSTPQAYSMLDRLYGGFSKQSGYTPRAMDDLARACDAGDIQGVTESMYNIFEEPILSIRPVATEIKRLMLENGAIGAMMSGSGPSVFGIFEDAQTTNSAANAINALGIATHLCEPVGATII